MKWLPAIILLALVAIGAQADRYPSDRTVERIAFFGSDNGAHAAGNCAQADEINNGNDSTACAEPWNILAVADPFVVNSVSLTVAYDSWDGTDSCDVSIFIDGVVQATTTIDAGGIIANGAPADLDALGTFQEINDLRISVLAGSLLTVRNLDPADNDQCTDGAACDCDGANAGYVYWVWGKRL